MHPKIRGCMMKRGRGRRSQKAGTHEVICCNERRSETVGTPAIRERGIPALFRNSQPGPGCEAYIQVYYAWRRSTLGANVKQTLQKGEQIN